MRRDQGQEVRTRRGPERRSVAVALGSVGSPGALLGQGIRVHPDGIEQVRAESGSRPLRTLRAPRLHLPSLPSHLQPLAILGHPEERETEAGAFTVEPQTRCFIPPLKPEPLTEEKPYLLILPPPLIL